MRWLHNFLAGYWRASRQGFSGKHRWEIRKSALRLGNRPEELRWEKEPHVEVDVSFLHRRCSINPF